MKKMERPTKMKLINKIVNLYFYDGTEVRKREGLIVDEDELNYFLKNRGLMEVIPKARLVSLEILQND